MSKHGQPAEAALMGLTFEELLLQAELIILGVVLDEKLAGPGTTGPGLENRTVSVEKVIKGTYAGNTVNVISESEIYEDSPKFKQGDRVILFLYQKPLFGNKPSGNDYAIVNSLQGQYGVDDNGLVSGLVSGDVFVNDMTIAGFEKKITDALASPESNSTQKVSNDTDYYRNDTDLITKSR